MADFDTPAQHITDSLKIIAMQVIVCRRILHETQLVFMARIFISYSRSDRQFVDELVPLLRKVYGNDSVWFDDDITGGSDWWQMILDEIAQCDLFFYLLSNDSLDSPYCQDEFREALRLYKPILPIVIRPKTEVPGKLADDLKPVLQKIHFIDVSKGFKDYHAISALYAAANKLLAVSPAPFVPHTEVEPPVRAAQKRVGGRLSLLILYGVTALIAVTVLIVLMSKGIIGANATPTATLSRLDVLTGDAFIKVTSERDMPDILKGLYGQTITATATVKVTFGADLEQYLFGIMDCTLDITDIKFFESGGAFAQNITADMREQTVSYIFDNVGISAINQYWYESRQKLQKALDTRGIQLAVPAQPTLTKCPTRDRSTPTPQR